MAFGKHNAGEPVAIADLAERWPLALEVPTTKIVMSAAICWGGGFGRALNGDYIVLQRWRPSVGKP